MKRIITYGTFDLLHWGHVNFLREAKKYGDYLIVSLADEEYNIKHSKKRCYFTYEKRKSVLEAIRFVDMVIPQLYGSEKIKDIKLYNIDICVMGGDWKGKFDFLKEYCDVVYLPRPMPGMEDISTSIIKRDLRLKQED